MSKVHLARQLYALPPMVKFLKDAKGAPIPWESFTHFWAPLLVRQREAVPYCGDVVILGHGVQGAAFFFNSHPSRPRGLSAEACPARQCPVASEMAWQAQAILGGKGVQTQATAAVAALPPPHSARCTLTGAAARGLPLSHAQQPAIWRSPHSPPGSAASGLAEPSLTLGRAASDLAGPSLTPLNQGTTDVLLFGC